MIKKWGSVIYKIGERRRLLLLIAAILLVGALLLYVRTARAATVVLLPNADIGTSTWSQCTSLTCSISRYLYVDEDASANTITSDYINTGAAGASDAAATVEFGLTTTSNVSSASNITVYILARSGTNANGGTLDGGLRRICSAALTYTLPTKVPTMVRTSSSWTAKMSAIGRSKRSAQM